jgi:glyoxylase-like metal-dependent hydrolase (beta-lactamase superfamily II)
MGSLAMPDDPWWKELPRRSWSRFRPVEQSQAWFEVYQVRPGVYAIYEPGQWEEVISYLITGSKQAILFDTGLGIGDMKKLVSELTPLETNVINSHTHYDHVGGDYQFQKIYGIDTEFSRKNSTGKPHEEMKGVVSEGAIWKPTPAGFSKERYAVRPFQITGTIKSGEIFDLGDRRLEIIFTPGHSPDSLCLIDRKNRLLFTGDTFYPAPLYAHLPGSDLDQYVQTARLLDGLSKDVDYLLPGHNETLLASDYLSKMYKGFLSIQPGTSPFIQTADNREYRFDGFSILVKQP